jgi:hypothetical protein
VDGTQWKNFDLQYKPFRSESRNIRFALSTDGMNPQDHAQHMAGHPRDVQPSNMVVSQMKVPYVVYSYPRFEASWHRY